MNVESQLQKNNNNRPDVAIATFVHLLGLITSWFGPLVLYLMKKDNTDTFTRGHILAALNFQIVICTVQFIGMLLTLVAWPALGGLLSTLIGLCSVVASLYAAYSAYNNKTYAYPIAVNFVK